MKTPREKLLRSAETPGEITLAIARAAHTIWESHAVQGNLANNRGCQWTSPGGTEVDYQQFQTAAHGHQAYITFTTHAPKIVKEFSIDLQSTEAAHGVAISEATPYGYYEDIDLIKDTTTRESRRLQVYTLLQDAMATLREPTAIQDEQIFAAMIIDMALDAHTSKLNVDSVNDVVAEILSNYDGDLGAANWLLDEHALRKRAAERAKDATATQ